MSTGFSTAHVLHMDAETRSVLDLKVVGAYVYMLHPTTQPWLISYAFDDEPVQRWYHGQPCPDRIADHVRAGGMIKGWNSGLFERLLWKCILTRRYGWPEPKLEQWDDSMVWALAMSFPGELQRAAQALGTKFRKDEEGHRLMLRMAKPRKVWPNGAIDWWDQPERIERLGQYCDIDVETEREISKHLLPLSPDERDHWLRDLRINDRGFKIDLPFVAAAKRVVARRVDKLNARLQQLTNGRVQAATNVSGIGQWMRAEGYPVDSLDKDHILSYLKSDYFPEHIKEVLRIRQKAGKSSTAKLEAMEAATCADSRARGMYQFNAAGTGRWSSKIIQVHNLPRGTKDQQKRFDELCEAIQTGDDEWVESKFGDPMDAVSGALRGCIVAAHGNVLVARDFSAIESRKLAWSAGEQWKLEAYRAFDEGRGPDIYRLIYARHFNIPVDQVDGHMRQIGKVKDLSMGYQGGVGAFVDMAEAYQMSIPELALSARDVIPREVWDQAVENFEKWGSARSMPRDPRITQREQWLVCESLKIMFRKGHPATVAYWAALEAAAISAVRYPGQVFRIQHDKFQFQDFRYRVANGHLWCRLPSGRTICYPHPQVYETETPWGTKQWKLTYLGIDNETKQWTRLDSYGGHLAENNTQGIGACYQRRAIKLCEQQLDIRIPVVAHTHDEIVAEVPERDGQAVLEAMGRIMKQPPEWAAGCPIASNGFITRRYRKE